MPHACCGDSRRSVQSCVVFACEWLILVAPSHAPSQAAVFMLAVCDMVLVVQVPSVARHGSGQIMLMPSSLCSCHLEIMLMPSRCSCHLEIMLMPSSPCHTLPPHIRFSVHAWYMPPHVAVPFAPMHACVCQDWLMDVIARYAIIAMTCVSGLAHGRRSAAFAQGC